MTTFEQTFEAAAGRRAAAARHAEGWRYVQILAVNTEEGIDLVYSYMKDGHLANFNVSGVKQTDVVPSITDLYLEAFVCENEIHDLFDVAISDIAIDFGGMFYQLAEKGPMTVVSPEQLAARARGEEDRRGKAPRRRRRPRRPRRSRPSRRRSAKIAGLDPEKAKVGAAMEVRPRRPRLPPRRPLAPRKRRSSQDGGSGSGRSRRCAAMEARPEGRGREGE
ncbi:MAG: hypothetical protein ACLUE1_04670 [Adlercreutzia equolifaciens]